MCILFVHLAAKPLEDAYKVILIANRDESFKRPTKIADFWGHNPDIVGGLDLEPGREGGTWLGISQTGKIAALLNILSTKPKCNKGRGFLVTDYLKEDVNIDGMNYCARIHANGLLYNPFNLVTIDTLKEDGPILTYYSNQTGEGPVTLNSTSVHSFGNSLHEKPFLKVKDGEEKFSRFVAEYGRKQHKQKLLDESVALLRCPDRHHPDPQIIAQASSHRDATYVERMSSKFVYVPSINFGSRTHTVILVDAKDQVEYHEWTMQEPIDDPTKPTWLHSNYNFPLLKN